LGDEVFTSFVAAFFIGLAFKVECGVMNWYRRLVSNDTCFTELSASNLFMSKVHIRFCGSVRGSHVETTHCTSWIPTPAPTQTPQSMWRNVKLFLGQYSRGDDYHLHLAHYMFMARCKEMGVPPFLHFLEIVTQMDWPQCTFPGICHDHMIPYGPSV
jgi:hypothetical protein